VPAGYTYPPVAPYAPYLTQPAPPVSGSTIVLTVISALLTVSCYFTVAGIAPLIIAIIALTRNTADPAGARRLTRIGWIVLGAGSALIVLGIVVFIAVVASSSALSGRAG
jgi:hypothetical protein